MNHCIKCNGYKSEKYPKRPECIDPSCECHNKQELGEKKCKCPVCQLIAVSKPQSVGEGWRERFDKEFDGYNEIRFVGKETGFVFPRNGYDSRNTDANVRIKSFIQSELEACAERVRGEERENLTGLLNSFHPHACDCTGASYECEHWGRHKLIDELLSRLKYDGATGEAKQ